MTFHTPFLELRSLYPFLLPFSGLYSRQLKPNLRFNMSFATLLYFSLGNALTVLWLLHPMGKFTWPPWFLGGIRIWAGCNGGPEGVSPRWRYDGGFLASLLYGGACRVLGGRWAEIRPSVSNEIYNMDWAHADSDRMELPLCIAMIQVPTNFPNLLPSPCLPSFSVFFS